MNKTITPENQDIFVIAPKKWDDKAHPVMEGAQDIIIGYKNGIMYHVCQETWKRERVDFSDLPEILQQMYASRTVLAYLPMDREQVHQEKSGYYLANFAIINNEVPSLESNGKVAPPEVYRVPQKVWYDQERPLRHMFRPGNSDFLLRLLNNGTTIAYITKAARTMDCFCYLLNLASINGKPVFDPKEDGACELPDE